MIWYKLKLSFRSLAKDKLNSIINILGLAVGMAAVILISIYVQHELSYDKFNTKQERIYKLISLLNDTGKELAPYEIGLRLTNENFANEIPEIEEITQLYRGGTQNAKVNDKHFNGIRCHYVDTNFHKVFTLEPISGQSTKLFSNPNGVVINASTAVKLFGTTNAAGKELEMFGRLLTVNAVVKDLPLTSHYDFDMLLPFSGYPRQAGHQSLEYNTYILVKQGVDRNSAIKKIEAKYTKILDDGFGEYGEKTGSYLQKLCDIHLRSDYNTSLKPGGNINAIYIHILLAFLILIIAMINFINIITVQYDGKLNQIGIKKAIGAERIDLIKDFLGRTTLMAAVALLFGVILAEIFMPFFGNLMNRELPVDYLSNPLLFIGLPVMTLFVGLISGLYPAITITRYTPAAIIKKGKTQSNHGTNLLSRILVIFQFSASIVLISAVIISQQQIDYMKNADLGLDTEQVIAITNLSEAQKQAYSSIKQELLKIPQITYVSASLHLPGKSGSGQIFRLYGTDIKNTKDYNEYRVRPDYFKTMGIQFVEGNEFNESQVENCKGIILNEAAVKYLEVDDALGRIVWFHEAKYEIQGIVKDFHYAALREKIEPLMFTCFSSNRNIQFVLLKVKTNNMTDLLPKIKNTFKKIDPERVNFHLFIDDIFRDRYQQEERSQTLTGYSSALSIILALLGLYSLTLFMVQKRTKEIGIRKVNGATVWQITSLLFSTFIKWIAMAFVISIPVSYYMMQHWLEQFAYHITIGALPFVFAGLITAIFALLVVGGQTWKAASQNPVDSLRSE